MTHDTPDETQRFRSANSGNAGAGDAKVIDITAKLRETARTLLGDSGDSGASGASGDSGAETAEPAPASNVTTVAFGANGARAARSDVDSRGESRLQASEAAARPVAALAEQSEGARGHSAGIAQASESDSEADEGEDDVAQAGEAKLLSKLRSRQLSVKEARDFLIEFGVPEVDAEEILERFAEWEYLDDTKLAEQLEYSFGERKKLGASGIAREMAKRGIPRELIDERTQELRENDSETVFEVARDRARRLQHLDREVAERRLLAFLQRRGFSGSIARDATRAALSGSDGRGSSVRFE